MGVPKDVQEFLDNEGDLITDLIKSKEDEVAQEEPEERDEELEQVEVEEGEETEESDVSLEEPETKEDYTFTPKKSSDKKEDDPSEITRKILEKLDSISTLQPQPDIDLNTKEFKEESDADRRIRELEERLAAYENRTETVNEEVFISDIRDRVGELFPTVGFEEIINSIEFDTYLNKTVFGVSKRTLLKRAKDERDRVATLEIFQDFKESFSPKKDILKPSLDDLAVPQKSGTRPISKRKSKFDFKASDYANRLRKFEERKMKQKDFNDFSEKFDKALNENRVDMGS